MFGEAALTDEGSAFRQVLLSDRLILTKSELAGSVAAERLEARLAQINPSAELHCVAPGEAHSAWFEPAALPQARQVPDNLLRARHDESIESFVLQWDQAQPLAAIGRWLQGLAETWGARLLRVKGIVAAEDVESAIAVHAIQHLVAPPDFLQTLVATSSVVFITRGLEPGDVAPPWQFAASAASASLRQRPGQAGSTRLPQAATDAFSGAAVRP
jgi:G3E family GTPase